MLSILVVTRVRGDAGGGDVSLNATEELEKKCVSYIIFLCAPMVKGKLYINLTLL